MRAYVPDYELLAPANLTDALALLAREPGAWQPLAGGTDLMVLFEAGKLAHKKFVSLWNFPELKGIEATADHVTLGALITYTGVQRNEILEREFPLLCRAASETGGIANQNRGTLAGNIVNASPAADSCPALLVYDAELEIISARGTRSIPYHSFHTGYKQMDLDPDELLARIRLPRATKPRKQYFRKVGTRKAQAIAKVSLAGLAQVENNRIQDVRIALGSVAPTVLRCWKTEAVLKNLRPDSRAVAAAQAELSREIAPIDDLRSTARYRHRVALNLLAEFLSILRDDGRSALTPGKL